MKHIFFSYLHEDWDSIKPLYEALQIEGVSMWIDRENLSPGVRWQDAIRTAIQAGDYFFCFFSKSYFEREKTFLNEELAIAIEEMRLRPSNREWFIPIRVDDSEIPEIKISSVEYLSDIQCLDLSHSNAVTKIMKLLQKNNLSQEYVFDDVAIGKIARTGIIAIESLNGEFAFFGASLLTNFSMISLDYAERVGLTLKNEEIRIISMAGYKHQCYRKQFECQIGDMGAKKIVKFSVLVVSSWTDFQQRYGLQGTDGSPSVDGVFGSNFLKETGFGISFDSKGYFMFTDEAAINKNYKKKQGLL